MNSQPKPNSGFIIPMLSIMMFLQFFTWGTWFATLSGALGNYSLAAFTGAAYEAAPIAAIFAPLFLGLIADRFFSSEKVMGSLMLVGGLLMFFLPGVAESAAAFATESAEKLKALNLSSGEFDEQFKAQQLAENQSAKLMVWLILGHLLCYMPTLGLGNTIAFTHIKDQEQFPRVRVWGTIGWIVAGLVVGIQGWSLEFKIFTLCAYSSIALGIFCFFLPNTPPPMKGQRLDLRSLLMVDAFKLMADRNFFVFAVCSMLVCIPLAFYYGSTGSFLAQAGFLQAASTMTLGQMSEIFFMILMPFFFRRLGVKNMILIGIAAWVVRYLLFAMGAPNQVTWMLILGVLLHGVCYDFFFVTGFIYTDKKAPAAIRGQAQSLLVFLTQGLGMFFGYRIMAGDSLFGLPLNLTFGEYGQQVTRSVAYSDALKSARGVTEAPSFLESLTMMFSKNLPANLDSELLSETMRQWANFWVSPAIMAAIVFVIFAVAFWDRTKVDPAE